MSDFTSKNEFLGSRFFLAAVAILVLLGNGPKLARAAIGFGVIPPTNLVATAGNAQATISFTASVGGGITGYTVTSSPGGMTATGSSSPITVTGLTNGTSYTFTATATNLSGIVSAASTPSNAVTPEAPVTTAPVTAPVGSILPGYTEHNPLPWETAIPNAPAPGFDATSTATSTETATTSAGTIMNAKKYVFNRNLALGMSGRAVTELQIFLNTHGFTVANFGPGSEGQETTYFGLLTKAALVRFQDAHVAAILSPFGLSAGTGYFGPSTRAFVNAMP